MMAAVFSKRTIISEKGCLWFDQRIQQTSSSENVDSSLGRMRGTVVPFNQKFGVRLNGPLSRLGARRRQLPQVGSSS